MVQNPTAASAASTLYRALALLQVLALNGVPIYGVYVLGWSWGTVLVLYCCETVMGTFFLAFRMILHRQATHDRAYFRSMLGGREKRTFLYTLLEFVGGMLFATFVQGLFLGAILGLILKGRPDAAVDLPALRKGLEAMALIMLGTFAVDCVNLRRHQFAWIEGMVQRSLGRIVVIQFAILFGMIGIGRFAKAPFAVFAAVKLLVEVGSLYGEWEKSKARQKTELAAAPAAVKLAEKPSGHGTGKRRGVHGRTRGR